MKAHHTPVMVQEVLDGLQVRPGGAYVDCTMGEGGHSLAIVNAAEDVRLLGLDLDSEALGVARQRLEAYLDCATLVHGNFAEVRAVAKEHGFEPACGVLFDLGMSSLQTDTRERGFSFRRDARLDMRFDPTRGITACQIVNDYDERQLADIIWRLGQEPGARRVARQIVRSRPIETTARLAEVVARALGRTGRTRIHPATRTFQAIRMAVNDELGNLRRGLEQAIDLLGAAGRLVVLSYHSLEDRLVKTTLRREASQCICAPAAPECVCGHVASLRLVNRRVTKPTLDEVRANPRSRSARMRVAERI